jgi:hypothetical protein
VSSDQNMCKTSAGLDRQRSFQFLKQLFPSGQLGRSCNTDLEKMLGPVREMRCLFAVYLFITLVNYKTPYDGQSPVSDNVNKELIVRYEH